MKLRFALLLSSKSAATMSVEETLTHYRLEIKLKPDNYGGWRVALYDAQGLRDLQAFDKFDELYQWLQDNDVPLDEWYPVD